MRYKFRTGSIAWLMHRITGIALTLYIFLHLYILSALKNPARYESLAGIMKTPLGRICELSLLALVSLHAFNGLRLVLIDLGIPSRLQKIMFLIAMTAVCLIVLFGTIPFLGGKN